MESTRGYKRKTIIKIIDAKIKHWLSKIDNEELREEIDNSFILTGGSIASMLLGEQVNDFDIYFDDIEVAKKVATYYVDKYKKKNNSSQISKVEVREVHNGVKIFIKSAGVLGEDVETESYQYFESTPTEQIDESVSVFLGNEFTKDVTKHEGKFVPLYISSNAITLSDDIQIILRFVGNAETIHANFDYLHATNYYSRKTGLILHPEALESILAKELKYVGSLYPIASIFRLRKFIGRNWTINVGEILKISWDISKLDLTDYAVLEEQLTGVDTAFFQELIQILKENSNVRPVDRSYLVELISRIFD